MGIRIIENQPIRFRLSLDDSCDCSTKEYCQMINKNDATQWQINSDDIVLNGNFTDNLNHWVIGQAIDVSAEITNETSDGACDGQLLISASGGTPAYTYSKDGITFQGSDTFTGLCSGCYNVVVKDSLGNKGYYRACIDSNIDCGTYPGAYLFDIEDLYLSKLLNCYLHDFL